MIDLLVLDVDGCLTDGKITYTQNGDEIKSFDVKDGLAIVCWQRMDKEVAIITGRESKIVQKRAGELGIKHLYQGVKDKRERLIALASSLQIPLERVAAIGDDLNDYRMLKSCGLSFAPQNGHDYIKRSVDVVLGRVGGDAAVREMIEMIIKKEGRYEEFLELWV